MHSAKIWQRRKSDLFIAPASPATKNKHPKNCGVKKILHLPPETYNGNTTWYQIQCACHKLSVFFCEGQGHWDLFWYLKHLSERHERSGSVKPRNGNLRLEAVSDFRLRGTSFCGYWQGTEQWPQGGCWKLEWRLVIFYSFLEIKG